MNAQDLFQFLPYVVLLLLILINRRELEREARSLSPDHRQGMDKHFNHHRFIQYGALVAILGAIFIKPESASARVGLVALQLGALIAWSLSALGFGRGVLVRLEIPEAYIKVYTRDRLLLLLLLGFFAVTSVWELWSKTAGA